MIRMLIVDDEQGQVRELVDIIGALRPDFRVSGVTSGNEALRLIESQDFDVVMTDIRMPGMDGLELIGRIVQIRRDMLLVILSGYGDFQYAKKAIEHGVIEYMVKPISRKSLQQLFERIDKTFGEKRARLEGEQSLHQQLEQSLPVYMEHQLNKWVLGEMNEDELREVSELMPDQGPGIALVCQIDRYKRLAERHAPAALKAKLEQAKSGLLRALQAVGHTIAFSLLSHPNRWVFVLQAKDLDKLRSASLSRTVDVALEPIEHELEISFTVGISSPSDHIFGEIRSRYAQAVQAADYGFFAGNERCIPYGAARHETTQGPLNLYELENRLTVEMNLGNLGTIYGILNDAFDQLGRTAPTLRPQQIKEYCVYVVQNLVEKAKSSIPEDAYGTLASRCANQLYDCEKNEELRRAMKSVMDELVGYRARRDADKNEQLVRACRKFIEQHYGDESLSLEAVAGHFHFNPSYLSNLFKTYAGIGYSDYVTQIRMGKAKELLERSQLKIYEISAAVGYSDSTYFIKLFKKETGISPNQFKKRHKA